MKLDDGECKLSSTKMLRNLAIGVAFFQAFKGIFGVLFDGFVSCNNYQQNLFFNSLEAIIDVLLSTLLLLAVVKKNQWFLISWVIYYACHNILSAANLLLTVYKARYTDSHVVPITLVLHSLINIGLLSFSWLIVVLYYQQCHETALVKDILYTRFYPRKSSKLPTTNGHVIYTIPDVHDNKQKKDLPKETEYV